MFATGRWLQSCLFPNATQTAFWPPTSKTASRLHQTILQSTFFWFFFVCFAPLGALYVTRSASQLHFAFSLWLASRISLLSLSSFLLLGSHFSLYSIVSLVLLCSLVHACQSIPASRDVLVLFSSSKVRHILITEAVAHIAFVEMPLSSSPPKGSLVPIKPRRQSSLFVDRISHEYRLQYAHRSGVTSKVQQKAPPKP